MQEMPLLLRSGILIMPFNLKNRSLLSLVHHTPAEIDYLVDLAIDRQMA